MMQEVPNTAMCVLCDAGPFENANALTLHVEEKHAELMAKLKRMSDAPIEPSTGIRAPHTFVVVDGSTGVPIKIDDDGGHETIFVRHQFYDDQKRRGTRFLGPLAWNRRADSPEGGEENIDTLRENSDMLTDLDSILSAHKRLLREGK